MKISFNAVVFNFLGLFVPFHFFIRTFQLFFGGFLTSWKTFEIQDGGSKMAAVWTS